MEVKGVVEQVGAKDVTTKWGTKKTYSLKVDGNWISWASIVFAGVRYTPHSMP
jgi:hypothetical protein